MEETTPQPQQQTRLRYREADVVASKHRYKPELRILLRDGRSLRDEIVGKKIFYYLLEDGSKLFKTECIGGFLPGYEAFIVSKDHPVQEVHEKRNQRVNYAKLQAMYPEHRVGRQLKVILVNGWEMVGTLWKAGQFFVTLKFDEENKVYLYRHAIADYEWPEGEPPPLTEEEARITKRQRADMDERAPRKRVPKVKAVGPPLEEVLQEEVERTMINAKIKIVLRDIPTSVREVGDIIWIPLQNQPGGLPKGLFELTPMMVDLVVSKKMWTNAKKKGSELKEKTGNNALMIVEAAIGMFQNRFSAVATGIQVTEGKPKS